MENGIITNQGIREKLEYKRAKELFPNCEDLAKKGRLWTIITNYRRKRNKTPLSKNISQRTDR